MSATIPSAAMIPDDGTVRSWSVLGQQEPNDQISLDVIGKFPSNTVIAESAKNVPFDFDQESLGNTTAIEVQAGDRIGVTLIAGGNPKTEHGQAEVACGPANRFHDDPKLGLFIPALHSDRVPNTEEEGSIALDAGVEEDAPVITAESSKSGPALGGEEITLKGEHLANATYVQFGYENEGTIVPGSNSDTELKIKTPEAVASGGVEGEIETAGSGTLAKFKYTYNGEPRSHVPTIALEPVSKITMTSAQLNAAVNFSGLGSSLCLFEVKGGPILFVGEEEEEEEGEAEEPCAFGTAGPEYTPDPVYADLRGLAPHTKYSYKLNLKTAGSGQRSGQAESPVVSFTTRATPGEGEEASEVAKKEEVKKELSAIIPITSPTITPTLVKGIAASPIVGLLGSPSLTPTPAGALPVKISCPAGESTCIGSIIIKTAGAITANLAAAAKKSVLTLATGTFKVPGGKTATVTLHLTAKARAALKHLHTLHARITITAHDTTGATHTTVRTITLHAPKHKR